MLFLQFLFLLYSYKVWSLCKLFESWKVLLDTSFLPVRVLSTIDLVFPFVLFFSVFRISLAFNRNSSYLSRSYSQQFYKKDVCEGIYTSTRRYISIVQTSNKFFFKNLYDFKYITWTVTNERMNRREEGKQTIFTLLPQQNFKWQRNVKRTHILLWIKIYSQSVGYYCGN